nr:unnamed protein product [Callosobruchus chinensis]
MFRGCDPLHPH